MKLSTRAVILVFLGTISCSSARPLAPPIAPPVHDQLIVPGARVGPIALGMSSASLFEIMGAPEESMRFKDSMSAVYSSSGVNALVLDATSQVFSISATDRRYSTAQGIQIGSTELEIRAKMGVPSSDTRLGNTHEMCYETGISFTISLEGRVQYIEVHPTLAANGPRSHC